MNAPILIYTTYFIVTLLFILGLRGMSSPVTARRGIIWAGIGMVLATLVTFTTPGMNNCALIIGAIILGGGAAWWSGRVVKITDMPQMIAVYNGMGGGAAAAIAVLELSKKTAQTAEFTIFAVIGALIGTISFAGSCVAFMKLQGIVKKAVQIPLQKITNGILALLIIVTVINIVVSNQAGILSISLLLGLTLLMGAIITLPIGGADMPVVISLLNAFTGLAVGFEGFVLNSQALIIAGIMVGSAGFLLTRLMARAMNRSVISIVFNPITGGDGSAKAGDDHVLKEISALDAASMLRYARKAIIVPGYGMAVGQAQYKVKELTDILEAAGVETKFAIHPVAGRMPGHMNVLLADAGVPYEKIFDIEDINSEFAQAEVALIIGANDVVNPAARSDASSPIYGMPILNADQAQNVIVIKRGKGAGYSGIENALFYADKTHMLYGSAQQAVNELIKQIKEFI